MEIISVTLLPRNTRFPCPYTKQRVPLAASSAARLRPWKIIETDKTDRRSLYQVFCRATLYNRAYNSFFSPVISVA